jgi:hypothetical protein
VEDSVCAAIYKAIPGAKYDQSNQGYIFPTSITAELPTVAFAVGEKLFTVQWGLTFADAGTGISTVAGAIRLTFWDTFLKSVNAPSVLDIMGGSNFAVDIRPREHAVRLRSANFDAAEP